MLVRSVLLSLTALHLAGRAATPPDTGTPSRADAGIPETAHADPVDLRGVVTEDDLQTLPTQRLLDLLGHEIPWTRLAAARVLARRGPESVTPLLDCLGNEDWRVVRAAQDGLLVMLRRGRGEGAEDEDAVRQAIIARLSALQGALQHEHHYVRMGALQCLGALGADAAPAGNAICDSTDDEDYLGVVPTALRTIRAVGPSNFGADRLLAVLETSVRSPHVGPRKAAIDLIERLEEKQQRRLIPAMLDALEHPMVDGYTRFHVQAQIARSLHRLGAEGTLPRILAILESGGWGEAHRVSQLMPILARYGPEGVEALPFLETFRERVKGRRALLEHTERTIEALREHADNGEPPQ